MKPRTVFLRGGGLGDFILSLPLLKIAFLQNYPVTFYARSSYLKLLNKNWEWLETKDLDELSGKAPPDIENARVISFWMDAQWTDEILGAGAISACSLNPRPSEGEHFVIQSCKRLGWEMPRGFSKDPILGDSWAGREQTLWIHPGSGGPDKNLPLEHFVTSANKWLGLSGDKKVIFSFGEADGQVLGKFRSLKISQDSRVGCARPSSILELRDQIREHADKFIGNDSGPGHLAASLGIPVDIGFCKTAVSVWKPIGPRVNTYFWSSDSSKIL